MPIARTLRTLAIGAMLPLLAAATPVELAVHVAEVDGAPIADAAWIDAQVEAAVGHFEPAGVTLTWRDAGTPAPVVDVLAVDDRDALAAAAGDRDVVHVFVVSRLADKDVEGHWLNGVHWRYGGDDDDLRGRRYVILARETRWSSTLAHELGHFFGLSHTTNADGLMTSGPDRGDGPPTLDRKQRKRIRARARAWARAR